MKNKPIWTQWATAMLQGGMALFALTRSKRKTAKNGKTTMQTNTRHWLPGLVWALAACLPLASQAEPYFTNKAGKLIWDKATGLVWMRCSLGQEWDGSSCVGKAKKFTFGGAASAASELNAGGGYVGFADWQVPTVRQLAALRLCSNGALSGNQDIQDGKLPIPKGCPNGTVKPAIDPDTFPGTDSVGYWTSSPDVDNGDYAWRVNFDVGYVFNGYRYYGSSAVRLVRASQLLTGEAALDFSVSIPRNKWVLAEEAARKKAEEDRIAVEKAVEKAAEKDRKDRDAAIKGFVAGGAQSLYLEAGKAQRNGGISRNGQSFYASDLYELIIEHFPKSEYAVKASDQLGADQRQRDAQNAIGNRRDEESRQCRERINYCQRSCSSFQCNMGCRSICSE